MGVLLSFIRLGRYSRRDLQIQEAQSTTCYVFSISDYGYLDKHGKFLFNTKDQNITFSHAVRDIIQVRPSTETTPSL